jgi:hypothetical protein
MLALLHLSGVDFALIVVAGFLSVMGLVRLMGQRQNAILKQLDQQISLEKQRRDAKKRHEEQRQLHERIRRKRAERGSRAA